MNNKPRIKELPKNEQLKIVGGSESATSALSDGTCCCNGKCSCATQGSGSSGGGTNGNSGIGTCLY